MASADGTHLWGHQKHLPHQPQLYEFQLDLADHEFDHQHERRPGLMPSAAKVNTTAETSAAGTGFTAYAAAADTPGALKAGHAEQPQHASTRAARFSLLAPEYSSDMPVISKTCYGMLLMLLPVAACNAAHITLQTWPTGNLLQHHGHTSRSLQMLIPCWQPYACMLQTQKAHHGCLA